MTESDLGRAGTYDYGQGKLFSYYYYTCLLAAEQWQQFRLSLHPAFTAEWID